MASLADRASGSTTGDQASFPEGVVLVMACWCTVLASGLLSPVLPQIAERFANVPHIDLLIGFVATMPALSVALLAMPFGWLSDNVGQRPVLLVGLVVYGVAGILPYWLDAIGPIIIARALVGIGEAAVMTASTALIGLRFQGERKGRWLAAQVAAANTLGIFVLLFGGLLGLFDWHAPFLAYGFALMLFLPTFLLVRSPVRVTGASTRSHANSAGAVQWRSVALICGLDVLATIAMFVIIVQMAFLLPERGATSSAAIGLGIACGAFGVAIGAIVSGSLARRAWQPRVAIGFALMGTGFVGIAVVSDFWATSALLVLSGLGGGAIIPALLAALVAAVSPARVGLVVGIWTAATFIAQFLNPPLFVLLRQLLGSQSQAVGLAGAATLLVASTIGASRLGRTWRMTASART